MIFQQLKFCQNERSYKNIAIGFAFAYSIYWCHDAASHASKSIVPSVC